MKSLNALLAVLLAFGLIAAACGDSEEGGSDTNPSGETTPDGETTPPGENGGSVFAINTDDCDDDATAPFEGSIDIGTSVPQSGGPAVLFAPYNEGQQAYIDFYNEENGGVGGLELKLISKDDQYTENLTVSAVEELVGDEGVDLISGIIGTPNNLAVRSDLNGQCIPQLWAASGAADWGEINEFPWTNGLLTSYDIESAVWADYVAAEVGEGAKVGLFTVDNEFGQSYVDAFEEAAEEKGIEIVATETIAADDSGAPSGQMTNLVDAAPDAILAVPLGAQCIAFMTELGNAQAANDDFDPLVYQTATCANPIFFGQVTNGGSDGVFSSNNLLDVNNPDLAEDPAVKAYLDAFAASGSSADPGGIATAGWVGMEATVQALEDASAAGDLSRAGVMNAVRNIDFSPGLLREGLTFQMDAGDGYSAEGTQIVQWADADKGFSDVGEVQNLEDSLGAS